MIAALFGRFAKLLGIPDPRALLAIILIWLGTLACLWAYMEGRATSLAETARAEAEAECSEAKTKAADKAREALQAAVAQARADWQAAQTEIDRAKAEDRAQIAAELEKHRDRAATLFRQLQAHINANPLPTGCRLDPDRVRLFNEARRAPIAGARAP